MRAPLFLFALSSLFTGCMMAIDGEVVDATGKPLPGVLVTAVGSSCNARSDEKGKFSLECTPDKYMLTMGLDGYVENTIDEYDASERKRYDLGKKLMVKIPDERGLFMFKGNEYVPMNPGRLARLSDFKSTDGRDRAFCLNKEESEINEFKPGQLALFDNEHPGWRAFKLDEEGCAYRDQKNAKHQWQVIYREKAEIQEKALAQGKTLVGIQLDRGDYFIADWDKGFFSEIDSEKHLYSGYWLHAGG